MPQQRKSVGVNRRTCASKAITYNLLLDLANQIPFFVREANFEGHAFPPETKS